MHLETKIYERGNSLNLKKLFKETLSDLYRSRYLAKQLASRDIKSQYRQSFLGIFWAFLMPLTTAFVWIFINDSGAVELADTGVPYPLFVFSGTLLFSALTAAINMPLNATNEAKGLFTKINIPKEAIILAGFYKLLYNDMFKMILLVFFFIFFSVVPTWGMLLFPITFLILTLVGITIGLLITPLGLLYNDVATVISLSLRFIMFITPVVYIVPKEGLLKILMELNPLTPLILVNRNLLLGSEVLYLNYFVGITAVTLPLFLIALIIYRVSIPVLVERFSS